ncbi:MAG TPA: hypothetical protein P5132_10755 [Bacteroidales bacterium]|nr:hypothetical protein [Bacteroidales bacterium]
MKKILFFLGVFLIVSNTINAQLFNTGQTLKKGVIALGAEPAIHVNGGVNGAILYAHAGYGLTSGIDFAVKAGVGRFSTYYVGADVEFALAKHISIAFGGHKMGDFGVDGTFLFDIPIKSRAVIYSGVDSDANFTSRINTTGDKVKETDFLVWIPVGVEIKLSKSVHFLFETSIGVTPPAYHIIGGGINLYF